MTMVRQGCFFLSLISHNFDDRLSSNFHRFVIFCICLDTPTVKTSLWQLTIVSSVFNVGTSLLCQVLWSVADMYTLFLIFGVFKCYYYFSHWMIVTILILSLKYKSQVVSELASTATCMATTVAKCVGKDVLYLNALWRGNPAVAANSDNPSCYTPSKN